jgi:hypothetical protein
MWETLAGVKKSLKSKSAYTVSMQLTLNIPDETAALLEAKGVRIPEFVEEMLAKEAQAPSVTPDRTAAAAAVDRILERQKNFRLDGLNIRDLIDEGRKY